ncbi:MAG: glycosyltransferase [Bacteriovoracia bacterium]
MSFWHGIKLWAAGGELAVIHEFHKPPYGGGNQFLLALIRELENQGIKVSQNRVGPATKVLLVNSFNFDFEKVKRYKNRNLRIIHRVDGPVSVYRSLPDSTIDRRISDWNLEMADATIMQSRYSKEMHEALDIHFKAPVIIPNAVNPAFFFRSDQARDKKRKIRIAGTSWSTNPKKGLALYSWLDENLDFSRYELSFMGRIESKFKNIKAYAPRGSEEVGAFLRQQDIYFMPSENECCSNALIEALTSGLPSVYKDSGSSPELVGKGGEPFHNVEEVPALFAQIADKLDEYREHIRVLSISEVGRRYSEVLKVAGSK